MHVDHHRHIKSFAQTGREGAMRVVMPQDPNDHTYMVLDVAASRPDIQIDFHVGSKYCASITGPWLVGQQTESVILAMLEIANDAVQENRSSDALSVIRELLEKRRKNGTHCALLRPIIVPVRQNWSFDVYPVDGGGLGPVDVWIRGMASRDVA